MCLYSHNYFLKGFNGKVICYFGLIKSEFKTTVDYFASNKDFYNTLEVKYKDFNLAKAKCYLIFFNKNLSASSISYIVIVTYFFLFLITLGKYASSLLIVQVNICYLLQDLFKFFLLLNSNFQTNGASNLFPIYTILVPLYKEIGKIKFVINSISNLYYPKSRLDIKIVVEEDDEITIKELNLLKMPHYLQIIKVPACFPRTKPKALNYASQYAFGDYLVIYDAEDYPEPYQLTKVLAQFKKLSLKYICIQARLNFYNANENLLTRLMSIEYAIWFDYVLNGLSNYGLIIPLGGNSCHFKIQELRKIGLWDPYNVTEDLDLGIRIYLNKYRTYMVNSVTLEEAPINLSSWIKQRARWIKGFIQTYIVFLKARKFYKISFFNRIAIDVLAGLSVYNFLTPLWVIGLFLYFIKELPFYILILLYVNLFLYIVHLPMLAMIVLIKRRNKINRKLYLRDIVVVASYPFYFILHTFASYLALIQLIYQPFKWNKTKHNVSKLL